MLEPDGPLPGYRGCAATLNPESANLIRSCHRWRLMVTDFTKTTFIGSLTCSRRFSGYRKTRATLSIRGWEEVCGSFRAQTFPRSQNRSLRSRSLFMGMRGVELDEAALMLVAILARNWKSSAIMRANTEPPWRRAQP